MENEEDFGLDSFFVNEDYVERKWIIRDVELPLLCSSMASVSGTLCFRFFCHIMISMRRRTMTLLAK